MRTLCGVPLLLLLLLTCQLATSTPIFDRDGAGPHSGHRSAGFGESIRDWFRMMKDRIVGKWQEWFGDEVPSFSAQDILNIDKTLEKRIQSYPDIFTDLWEKYGPDCDTDEWDFKSWIPTLPTFPNFDWLDIPGFGKPELPTTVTPRTESTTRETTLRPFDEGSTRTATQTEQPSVLTTAGTTVSIAESTATSPVTQVTTTGSTESTVTSTEEITTPTVTSGESTVSTTESIATSTEPILIPAEPTTTSSTESIATTDELESSTMSSTEPILTSTESTMIASESTMTLVSEEVIITESPTTPFDLTLPVYNSKRVEDNETIEREKPTKAPKNRPSSAEVIMF